MCKYKMLFVVGIALAALLTTANGQWLETTITVGDGPCALVWNSTNNKVYCANIGNDNVTVIDGATNAVITTITVGDGPRAFCWNSTQNRTYVANYYGSSISVIRDVGGAIEEENRLPLTANRIPLKIYPNPARSYFTIRGPLSENCIAIYDVSGKLVREVKLPNGSLTSIAGIKNGVYFVKVNGEMIKEKLVVTK